MERPRVRVTGPRTRTPVATGRPPAVRDLAEQTEIGDLLLRSLVRTQLALALRVLTLIGGLFGGLPLLFATAPGIVATRVATVPLPWLLLGVVSFVAFAGTAWLYARVAARNEREFADLVRRG